MQSDEALKYDVKVVIILLMVCFYQLNPIDNISIVVVIDVIGPDRQENMFGAGASIEESFQTLLTKELSLFKRLFISSSTCVDPLT